MSSDVEREMDGDHRLQHKSDNSPGLSERTRNEHKNNKQSLLLERIRKQSCFVVKPTTEEEARQKAKLIADHRSEFPSKLRPAIEAASRPGATPYKRRYYNLPKAYEMGDLPESRAEFVLSEVYEAMKELFMGRPIITNRNRNRESNQNENQNETNGEEIEESSKGCCKAIRYLFSGRDIEILYADNNTVEEDELPVGWHGLDSDIDTEDEVELAIRFFPSILDHLDVFPNYDGGWCGTGRALSFGPTIMLLTKAKAVSFLPVFLKLHIELDVDDSWPQFYGLWHLLLVPGFEAFAEFSNDASAFIAYGNEETPAKETNEEHLSTLIRVREMGKSMGKDCPFPTFSENTEGLLIWVLEKAKYRERNFTEKRLRLLIDWNPSLLTGVLTEFEKKRKPCCEKCSRKFAPNLPLLCVFLYHYTLPDSECSVLRMFELILELGMTHYPRELGFLFHPSGQLQRGASTFHDFSSKYGIEKVRKITNDQIISILHPNNKNNNNSTRQQLVFAAATNTNICLDGLYILFSSDPIIALIPGSSTSS